MDEAQRKRIQKHQRQMKLLAERRKQQQAAAKLSQPVAANPPPTPKKLEVDPSSYNNEVYIVGGGPSLTNFNWKLLDGKFVIAINRAYEVLPNADILYFTDPDFWQRHRAAMLKHKGVIYRGRIGKKPDIKEVNELQLHRHPAGWSDVFGELYHGQNSTYACIQLAAQLGFTKIFLLGIDMKHHNKYDRTKKNCLGVTHWHDGHRRIDPPTAYNIMLKHYDILAKEAKKRNIEIINVNSPDTTELKVFPIKSVAEVFAQTVDLNDQK